MLIPVLQGNVGLNIVWTKSSNFVQTLFKVCLKYVQIHTLFILCSNTGEKIHTLFNPCSNFFTFVHWLFNTKEMKWAILSFCSNLVQTFLLNSYIVQTMFKFQTLFKLCSKSNFVQTLFNVEFMERAIKFCSVQNSNFVWTLFNFIQTLSRHM